MIEKIWIGSSVSSQLARLALTPLEGVYRTVAGLRGRMYDVGLLRTTPSPIDVVSVGNLTVGGTGKTPVAAFLASRLASVGRKPAIVLRGYGADEPLVHSRLNPGIPVIVDRDRRSGIRKAASLGADIAVLDDAFQHRSAERMLDLVLISADDWTADQRMLPAGPYRESPSGLRRASAVIVTAKAATPRQVESVVDWIRTFGLAIPVAVVRLQHADLVRAAPPGEMLPVSAVANKRVVAVAAIGNPTAFFRQLEDAGATVIPVRYNDHHAFTADDVARIGGLSRTAHYTVCTLKDAVKLAPQWPASEAPLWYVSLSVEVESGEAVLDGMLRHLPARRG